MSAEDDWCEGPEEEDPLTLSPQVEEVRFSLDTPADVMSAVSSVMVEMREALELAHFLPVAGRSRQSPEGMRRPCRATSASSSSTRPLRRRGSAGPISPA